MPAAVSLRLRKNHASMFFLLNDNKIRISCSLQSEGCFWSCRDLLRGLSNTFDMIRMERCSCRMDRCISLRGLGNFCACHVSKRPCVIIVESYESYEWRKCLSTRQSKLSSGQMHLIGNFCACHVRKRPCVMVVESYDWRKCLSTRESKLSSGQMHLICCL